MTNEQRELVYSVKAYRALLFLYPADFRREFGPEIVRVFEDVCRERGAAVAWRAVAVELSATLTREHAAAAALGIGGAVASLLTLSRLVLAIAPAVACCLWLAKHATRPEDVVAVTAWGAGVALGMARGRGRGWGSVFGAVIGGTVGTAVLIAHDALSGSPNVLRVASLLLAVSGAAAFAWANYVRLCIEGVELTRSCSSARATASAAAA